MMTWKPSMVFCRAAMRMPSDVITAASSSSTSSSATISKKLRCTPSSGAASMMMAPWIIATVEPPATLPSATPVRDTGATSTSRRNPNSRSHTMDTAEKMAVNSTVMPRMPGKRNSM